MKDNMSQILERSIQNLRENLDSLSLDTFVAKTLETLMSIEREEYLEKKKEEKADKGNGYYERAMKTLSRNSLMVKIPRTREGLFSPATIELLKINREKVDEIVLSLYKKGMTAKDIESFLEEVFEGGISPAKISKMVEVFHQFRIGWQEAKLEKHYKVVYADVIFVTVKRGNEYAKEGVFIATGVREDNLRELIILDINPTETANYWGELLLNLKEQRGVEKIDLFIADGIPYLEDEVFKIYPSTEFQKCVIHKIRSILNRTSPKDKDAVAKDLKVVFDNFDKHDSLKEALEKVARFLKKWEKKYPNFKRYFKEGNIEYYFTYIKFEPVVRRMIYTTNSLENLNRQIRKTTRNKLSFESPDRLLDYLFMIIKEFEEKNYMKYPISNFKSFHKFSPSNISLDTIF